MTIPSNPLDMKPYAIVRLAYNMDEPKLRGRIATFYEYRVFTHGDVPRARVTLIEQDGSNGEEYLVRYSCMINF